MAKIKSKEESKGIIEKFGDAVDHVLHPDKPSVCPKTDEPCEKNCDSKVCNAEEFQVEPVQESRPQQSDIANHPKFDKFKTGEK